MMHQAIAIVQRFSALFPSSGYLDSALILLASLLTAIIIFSDVYAMCFYNGFYIFKHIPIAVYSMHLV